MQEWYKPYEGLIPGIEDSFPEENWTYFNSITGHHIHTYRYPCAVPRAVPRAVLILFHGVYTSANSLAHLAKSFSSHSFTCFSLDQVNHGKSGGTPGAIRDLNIYVQDSINYTKLITETYTGLPVFILGDSLGGYIATGVALELPHLAGTILLAPALGMSPDFEKCLRKVVRVLAFIYKGTKLKRTDYSQMSRNKYLAQAAEACPYNFHGRMDAGTAVAFLDGFTAIEGRLHTVRTPLLVFQGGQDQVIHEGTVRNFVDSAESTDKELVFIPEMWHAVPVEPNIWENIELMTQWAAARV